MSAHSIQRKIFVTFGIFLVTLFSTSSVAFAHPFNYAAIQTKLRVDNTIIHMHMEVSEKLPILSTEQLKDYFLKHMYILNNGRLCTFSLKNFQAGDTKTFSVNGDFTCKDTVTTIHTLTIHTNALADFFEKYDNFVTVSFKDKAWDLVFVKERTTFPTQVQAVETETKVSKTATIFQFLWYGITHIFTGYDHILFLLSIILLARSLRRIVILVTTFTVAHSVTLLLASFHIITISDRIVEPIIAFSIICMALLNVKTLRGPHVLHKKIYESIIDGRWLAIFGFGLIHGLGFAGALTETHIPQEFFIPSLIFFNVGIELGQLAIIGLLFPLLLYIDTKHHHKRIYIAISGIVFICALFWLIQRIFFV